MLERRSPLSGLIGSSAADASRQGAPLVLSEPAAGALWQIAGWRDFEDAADPVMAALGFNGLGDHRLARSSAEVECYRIAPDRILLQSPDVGALLAAFDAAPPGRLAILDLSHARTVIRASGPAVVDLMARLAPLDLSLPVFPDDGFAQTGIHGVPVLIRRRPEDVFDLFVPVTWAVSVWEWVCENARPFGYAVEAPGLTNPVSRRHP